MTKEELKNKCTERAKIFQQAMESCKSSNPMDCVEWFADRIADLEKENAELKEKLKPENCLKLLAKDGYVKFTSDQLYKTKELIKELSKSLFLAKGIIRDLIDETVNFKESKERATYCYEQAEFDTYKKAEQFLSEVEK